ncbi:HTH-type transcriptional regulator SarZ [Shimia sp. SK013]|nr:HTH-type transcriptional regulator SarZ [Shimia sp. SK013]
MTSRTIAFCGLDVQERRMSRHNEIPATSQSLSIALLRAREKVMGPVRKMLADVGVTEQQWRVLRVLVEDGPLDPTTISERAVLLLPSLTRILQKLEDKELVTRGRDQFDGRRHVITLTEAGEAIIAANIPEALRLAEVQRDRLGAEKYDQLLALLNDLNADGGES